MYTYRLIHVPLYYVFYKAYAKTEFKGRRKKYFPVEVM